MRKSRSLRARAIAAVFAFALCGVLVPTAAFAVLPRPSAAARSWSYTSIRVSWTPVAGASGYTLYRASISAGAYSLIKTTTSVGHTDAGKVTGHLYYYKVRAFQVVGGKRVYGSMSPVVSAAPVPSAVTSTMLGRPSTTSATVKWNGVAGASAYRVYRAPAAAGPYTLIATTASRACTSTGLAAGAAYFFKVRAYHVEGTRKIIGSDAAPLSISLASRWSRMTEGNVLAVGQALTSSRGQYTLDMQSDGNLVMHYATSGRVLWNSGTSGHPGAVTKVLHDGRVAVVSTTGTVLWATSTSGKGGPSIAVGDDGCLNVDYSGGTVALRGINDALCAGEYLYADQYILSADRRYELVMQTEGNFVMYQTNPWKAIWATNIYGTPNYAVMQGDGNLVVYKVGGGALWSTGTGGNSGAYCAVQTDGNLVLYTSKAIWSRILGKIGGGGGGGTIGIGVNQAPAVGDYHYYSQNPFYQSGWGMPNCTCYAWGRAWVLRGSPLPVGASRYDFRGNAHEWWNETSLPKGSTPRLGAIAVWGGAAGVNGYAGHVAIVEAIQGSDVIISESSYGGFFYRYGKTVAYTSQYGQCGPLLGYIYIW